LFAFDYGLGFVKAGKIQYDKKRYDMTLVLENNTYSAEAIARRIKEDICSLGLEPGTRLQPLRELTVRYGTSYMIMRKAINILCDEGLLSSRRGAGIYVCDERLYDYSEADVTDKTIAMLFFGIEQHVTTSPTYSRLLYGIEKEAEVQGYNVIISLLKKPENFHQGKIYDSSRGFLALGDDLPGMRNLFEDKPLVWVMGADKKWGDQVSYNNKSVGELAAKTLIERGHKHLASINVDNAVGTQRCESFRLHATVNGAIVDVYDDPSALICTRFEQHIDQEKMARWVETILKSKPMPTGIFVVDMAAQSLCDSLVDNGLRPGSDIEVITCNCVDVPAFRRGYCPLNIDIYAEEVGVMAVRQLQWRLNNPDSKRVVAKLEPSIELLKREKGEGRREKGEKILKKDRMLKNISIKTVDLI
jgi:DNA-binding LacI/PurR family transcriptional regulator